MPDATHSKAGLSPKSAQWLAYFEGNEHRPSPDIPPSLGELPFPLKGPLIRALQCFQLGESGEGRLAHEAACSNDPALDGSTKRAIALYVREEGRHARELAMLLRAMGAPTIRKDRLDRLFERSRRLLGLHGKMAVLAAAEIVGSTFYRTLEIGVPCPHVSNLARVIGEEEERHLAFQRDYFEEVLSSRHALVRPVIAIALSIWFLNVLLGAVASVALGHRKLFKVLGIGPLTFAAQCVQRAGRPMDRAVPGVGANPIGRR